MKPLTIAGACLALSLLTYFQFPGHSWLQQDSQIYAPILEYLRDPSVLRNELLAEKPHVAYTLYDETARVLRAVTGLDFRDVLACEQIVARAFGIWGLYLMALAICLRVRAPAGRADPQTAWAPDPQMTRAPPALLALFIAAIC